MESSQDKPGRETKDLTAHHAKERAWFNIGPVGIDLRATIRVEAHVSLPSKIPIAETGGRQEFKKLVDRSAATLLHLAKSGQAGNRWGRVLWRLVFVSKFRWQDEMPVGIFAFNDTETITIVVPRNVTYQSLAGDKFAVMVRHRHRQLQQCHTHCD